MISFPVIKDIMMGLVHVLYTFFMLFKKEVSLSFELRASYFHLHFEQIL